MVEVFDCCVRPLGGCSEDGYDWIIDPIDGTQNIVLDIPEWVTSVAVVHDSESVSCVNVAPALGDCPSLEMVGYSRIMHWSTRSVFSL
ncbi:inositol monophosphatase family protein [Haloprofundus salilacus]|uniref:inositol monophosphatase family protein n=1 Tax=Haloprofundus salilacus TaxID=2876190 RepID=UPI001CC9102E|nr:inositol monophosphatase family protein [Haloprofundus salilacus]